MNVEELSNIETYKWNRNEHIGKRMNWRRRKLIEYSRMKKYIYIIFVIQLIFGISQEKAGKNGEK
jgi:hypothetical protein